MGKKIVAVAVLLATSVNPAVITHSAITKVQVGMPPNPWNALPMITDRPDTWKHNIERYNNALVCGQLPGYQYNNTPVDSQLVTNI